MSRGTPEARSGLCVCRDSFLMTFAMGGAPKAGSRQCDISTFCEASILRQDIMTNGLSLYDTDTSHTKSKLSSLFFSSSSSLSFFLSILKGFSGGARGKEPTHQCKRRGFSPWVGKIPWRRAWQPSPVFLLGEPLRQRSLVGYSPWGHKESDMTEAT